MSSNARRLVVPAIGFAVAIAAFSAIWLVVMTMTGWYRDADRMELGIVVPIVEVVLLVFASVWLRRNGCSLGRWIGLGLGITLLAAILSAAVARLYTSTQPDFFSSLQRAHAEGLRQAGRTDAEIAAMPANHRIATPNGFAANRFRNTIVFGIAGTIVGALAGIGRWKKSV